VEPVESGFLSIVPSLIALSVALATRRVILSLGAGVWVGMTIYADFNPVAGFIALFERGLFAQLGEQSNATVVLLICIISGFVHVLERSGGMKTFAAKATRVITSRRKTQLAVWVSGMAIFFTDSGNSLILGPLFRPIFSSHKICREKLAFLLDSTSSPVSILVPVTSWGIFIMSLIDRAHGAEPEGFSPFGFWLDVLPFQFYPILAVLSVPLFVFFGREFGPMRAKQRLAEREGAAELETQTDADGRTDAHDESEAPAMVVMAPLAVLFATLVIFCLVFYAQTGAIPAEKLQVALAISYSLGILAAALLMKAYLKRELSWAFETFLKGVGKVISIVLILLLAWSLADVCQLLGTGAFVASVFESGVPGVLFPPAIFMIGVFISMATGSSWGTFAILIPIAIPVAAQIGVSPVVATGAVLSGGMFGDHTSPISDTTILSSMASGCRHADHVRTQLPYAAVAGVTSLVFFVFAGFVASPWLLAGAVVFQFFLLTGVFVLSARMPAE